MVKEKKDDEGGFPIIVLILIIILVLIAVSVAVFMLIRKRGDPSSEEPTPDKIQPELENPVSNEAAIDETSI